MSVERALQRVGRDISEGDYGKARDRLHGLVASRPNDLELRRRLGGVYWQLQYPTMAGRYWYLEEDKSPEMAAAARAFEAACGRNPVLILRALKFKGDPEALGDRFARETLLALRRRAKEECGYDFEFGGPPGAGGALGEGRQRVAEWLFGAGCLLAVGAAAALMLIGLGTVLRWLFG